MVNEHFGRYILKIEFSDKTIDFEYKLTIKDLADSVEISSNCIVANNLGEDRQSFSK